MTINVTQKHIDTGRPFKSNYCPTALAIQEATGDKEWRVSSHTCYKNTYNDNISITLPTAVQRWILYFDSGSKGEPFSFELPIEARI